MAALLALSGAFGWGAGDFLGGLAARRLAVLTVLAVSQAVGLVSVLVWVVFSEDAFPGVVDLLPAAGAGIAAMVGLGALYRGFAIGAMGIVAPISAAAPVVPLAVDASRGDLPDALQWVGVALVLTGIGVLSRESRAEEQRVVAAGAGLAVVAALGFGLFFVGIVAVLSSLYPVVTIVLAWVVLGERLSAAKRAGGVVALGGAALVAAA